MIDPANITRTNMTKAELEEYILFWVTAAGKNGRTAARSLDKFLKFARVLYNKPASPFTLVEWLHNNYEVSIIMKECGIGCYNSKAKSFTQLAKSNLNLEKCTADELESIHGIGMKTARCFIIHSRKNARYAGLDTHMLKHLRAKGVADVPKATPGSKKEYLRLEKELLSLIDKAGMSPAKYDLMIWNKYSIKSTPRG